MTEINRIREDQLKHARSILKDIKGHYQLQAGGFQFALNVGIEAIDEEIERRKSNKEK